MSTSQMFTRLSARKVRLAHFSDVHFVHHPSLRELTCKRALGWLNLTAGGRLKHFSAHARACLLRHLSALTHTEHPTDEVHSHRGAVGGGASGVDFCLFTGDMTNMGLPSEYKESQEAVRQAFPERQSLFMIPGNHDLYTHGCVEGKSSRFEQYFSEYMGQPVDGSTTFPSRFDRDFVRVIGMNPCRANTLTQSSGVYPDTQLQALETYLTNPGTDANTRVAQDSGIPPFTILATHYPSFSTSCDAITASISQDSADVAAAAGLVGAEDHYSRQLHRHSAHNDTALTDVLRRVSVARTTQTATHPLGDPSRQPLANAAADGSCNGQHAFRCSAGVHLLASGHVHKPYARLVHIGREDSSTQHGSESPSEPSTSHPDSPPPPHFSPPVLSSLLQVNSGCAGFNDLAQTTHRDKRSTFHIYEVVQTVGPAACVDGAVSDLSEAYPWQWQQPVADGVMVGYSMQVEKYQLCDGEYVRM